ncbi:MAG TPA: protoporphyrinogen oxidase, partial [Gammaproteobacteria bacterium]|nr:protoporphyrinogen oxidase [Gammaproteobacteria bacterium]
RHVIAATPASVTATLVAKIDSELAELLHGINYAAVTVVHMGVDRHSVDHPLDGTGFLAPGRESTILTGNLWMSSLFPGRAPPGKVLLTSYLGGMRAPQAINWSDERVVEQALKVLRPLIGLKADPDMVRIDRHREALPVYHGAYQKRLQAIEGRLQQLPGLHLEANYRGGVSVRDRLARGRDIAKQILGVRQEILPGDTGMAAGKVGASSDFKGVCG